MITFLLFFSLTTADFHVAPMQCFTNRYLRALYRMMSSKAVLWTEMEKCDSFLSPSRSTNLGDGNGESPLVLQLGGNNERDLKQAALSAKQYDLFEINLNAGRK